MAVSKNQKSRGNSTRKKSTKGRSAGKRRQQSGGESFQSEIILLIVLAVCALLMIGNLGMGGDAGRVISAVSFGLMGLMAYVFPIFLFMCTAFLISNKNNRLAYKKILSAVVLFVFLCGLAQLVTEGYTKSSTLSDYYSISSDYQTGGGVLGGAICFSTTSAFGTAGSYIIIAAVLMVCLILITQRSFFGFAGRLWEGIRQLIQGGQERYLEGQPERELKKEIRQQERRQRREERLAQRRRILEEELEQMEEEEEQEEQEAVNGSASGGRQKPRRKRTVGKAAASGRVFQTPPVLEPAGKPTFREDFGDEPEDFGDVPGNFEENPENFEEDPGNFEGDPGDFEEDVFGEMEITGRKKGDFQKPSEDLEETEDQDIPERETVFDEEKKDGETSGSSGKPSGKKKVEFKIHRAEAEPVPGQEEPEEEDIFGESEEELLPLSREDLQKGEPSGKKSTSVPEERPRRPQSGKNPRSSEEKLSSDLEDIRQEIGEQAEIAKKAYRYPPLKLLKKGNGKSQGDSDEYLRKTAQKLHDTLHNFGVNVTITNISCGPTVTRYELQPEMGVKVSRIVGLADDIKLNLAAADIRIEAPIPGKAAVGIEVPNKENSPVMLRDLLQSKEFQEAPSRLSFAVGKDIAGKPVVADIGKMPHLLIAGATGSGKSVCINTLIISLLYKASPDEVKLIMVDPKVVELSVYNGVPHLLIPVVTDPKKAAGALNWAVSEMTSRYNAFAEYRVRNLSEYNKKIENMTIPEGETRPEKLPQIVIIVDELADLMMVAPGEVEDSICRLAQLARAAGIHLIIATQRPSVNVITGLIKANMPSRIAFSVSSGVDSRTILDMHGAEKLLGKGDMLFYPQGYPKPARLQGAFVSDEEVSDIVEFLKDQNPGNGYSSNIQQQMSMAGLSGGASGGDDRDTYFEEAGKFIIDKEKASIGMLQRMFKIGFNRAARIMDQLADAGVVGPEEGTKPRKVLMSMEEFENYIEESL